MPDDKDDDDKGALEALDSEDKSKSVAEARHAARKFMLIPALDALFEIGMNSFNKPMDRINALRYVADFASEAQGSGSKTVGRLSPQAARMIARMGLKDGQAKLVEGSKPQPGDGDLLPDEAKGERVGGGGTDDDENDD